MTDSSTSLSAPPAFRLRLSVTVVVALIAFGLYWSTLVPGLDFGDTASFQARVGDPISPRDAYPLYYAVGSTVVSLTGTEPAFGLNLTSAICGALAAGVLAWLASGLTGSLPAGAAGGLLLATSYTFWTQAIIAEVYALHLLLMGMVLTALAWWDRRRTLARLTVVFALYALAFGNHLMTVLLAPAIILFVATAPGGLRLLLSPRTIAIAACCAAAGASQYLWNASYLWHLPDPPASLGELVNAFWFDVTKSDWRERMVFAVHPYTLRHRPWMYAFDLRQQVGLTGVVLALAGAVAMARRWRLAVLVGSAYLTAFVFAYTYNVGDVHVFFLPSHQMMVLAAAFGVAALESLARRTPLQFRRLSTAAVVVIAVGYPVWRAWDTWPAVNRADDHRPDALLSAITNGLDERTLFLDDVNWQLEKGFEYYTTRERPELNATPAADNLLTLPLLVRNNLDLGRDVIATPIARDLARAAYGDLFTFTADPLVDARSLPERLAGLPPGTPYVLGLITPYADVPFDRDELAAGMRFLTGGTATLGLEPSYVIVAGLVGQRPTVDRREDRPYRMRFNLGEVPVDVRMDSWLPGDTIRRAGFGHVIVGRRHVLTLERGVSVVALSATGSPLLATYASSLFAPLPRFRVGLQAGRERPRSP